MHVRQQLREAIVAAVTGLASTGARVYSALTYPALQSDLPHLEVNTVEEQAESVSLHGPGLIERTVVIEITARAIATSGLATMVDDVAAEVETALGGSVMVSGKEVPLSYQGASIQFSSEADQPVGVATLRYQATLYTASNAPGTLVNG